MKNSENLLQKIPKKGISKKGQKLMPLILEEYFKGKSLQSSEKKFGKRNEGHVEEVYKRVESIIKEESLKKITPFMAIHKEDVKYDTAFIDTILKYCIQFRGPKERLERRLLDSLKRYDNEYDKKTKDFLERRYKKEEYFSGDANIIKEMKSQKLYLFIAKNIL
jgi:predicted transcriptional regulator